MNASQASGKFFLSHYSCLYFSNNYCVQNLLVTTTEPHLVRMCHKAGTNTKSPMPKSHTQYHHSTRLLPNSVHNGLETRDRLAVVTKGSVVM